MVEVESRGGKAADGVPGAPAEGLLATPAEEAEVERVRAKFADPPAEQEFDVRCSLGLGSAT